LIRLRLTIGDLSRIRFVGSLGPVLEARFAETRYADATADAFTEWRLKVRRKLRGAPGIPSPRRPVGSAPADTLRFGAAAVEPFWGRIRTYLEHERQARGRDILAGGVAGVLGELHPSISWHAPYLQIDGAHTGSRCEQGAELLGEGLVIAPSLFAPAPMILDARTGGQGAPVLVYNVTPSAESAAGLWQQQEEDRATALSDLLGNTRAHVLQSLRSPSSIGEISRRLDLSHPSVSKHLGVLRRSGLAAAERHDSQTLHRLTDLGAAVLGRPD